MEDKFIIFDFDGVLADSINICCEEVNILRESLFPQLPAVFDQEGMALLYSGILRTSLRRFGLTDEQSRLFFDLHSQAMERRVTSIQLFDEVVEIFFAIPENRRAIVTSAYSFAVQSALKKYRSVHRFQQILILGREMQKPKSKKFEMICSLHNIPKDSIITVGDTASDILYAQEFGVSVCAVGWGYHPMEYLHKFKPDFTARSPDDLRKILGIPIKFPYSHFQTVKESYHDY